MNNTQLEEIKPHPGYGVLNGYKNEHNGYELASILLDDAHSIMEWRNQQLDALRQKTLLSASMQNDYFKKHVEAEFSKKEPDPLLFRYTLDSKLIGYGGLVHIDWTHRIAEVSFLLETERSKNTAKYVEEFSTFLGLLKKIAFERLGFHKLTTESFSHRQSHASTIENSGFKREGVLREHTIVNGNWTDAILASCLKAEHDARK